MKEQYFLKVSITRDVPNTAEIHIEAPDDDMDEQSLQEFIRQAVTEAQDDPDGDLRWEEDLSRSEGLTVRAMDKVIRLEPDPKGLGYDVKTYLEMADRGEMDAEEFLRRTANMAKFHGFEVDDCLIRDDVRVKDDPARGETSSIFVASLETAHFSFLATGATEDMAKSALTNGLKKHAAQYGIQKNWWHECQDDIHVSECPAGGCLRDGDLLPEDRRVAQSVDAAPAAQTKEMERAFHNGMLPQPGEGTVTGTVRALTKDANANAFALVDAGGGKVFAVPMDPMRTWALVVGETATFQAVDGVRHYDLAYRLHASATPDSGPVPGGKTDFEP
ncbi:hypothetical protein [Acidithiobacillus sp.]